MNDVNGFLIWILCAVQIQKATSTEFAYTIYVRIHIFHERTFIILTMYYKYNLHQLLHLSENKNSVIAKDNSFRRLFSVWKMNKYYMEIECLYLIVAHRKWPPLSLAVCRFSFLSSLLLFFSLLLLPLVFQHHSFHPRIKQRGLHSITIANRTHPFLCVLLSGLMYLFLSHTCPLSYSVRLRMCRYTHDARSLASVSTITLFFLFFFFFPLVLQHVSSKPGQ